jgi:hypothetical protein
MTTSIKHCFKAAAGFIGGDLNEKDFHLAELRVFYRVNALWQPELRRPAENQRKRLARIRDMMRSGQARLGKLESHRSRRRDNFKILVQARSELFTADCGEIKHGEFSHKGHKGRKAFSVNEFNAPRARALLC